MGKRFGDLFRTDDLRAVDPGSTPGLTGGKRAAEADRAKLADRLSDLQEQLYAEGRSGGTRSVLLVLQGMDTSGKGGAIDHVVGQVDPAGVQITAFKTPTPQERRRGFLWRIRRRLPQPGDIGVFDRSHYEDVLVPRVEGLEPEEVWRHRYEEINAFEAELGEEGVTILKCMLHISPAEQVERLLARLDNPAKRWKYNPGDLDARAKWPAYMQAYADALRHCDSDAAPWYVVPADRKWYRNWVVAALLAETLADVDPRFPEPDVDVDVERARLMASMV
jgi:PPK2 family polyphosphate:nucleotide phosphotransferase